MGLPSGVQWASCNVGAARPYELGLYFSWGNIEGHELSEEYDFSQAVYDTTPAAAISENLSLDQDAARAYLHSSWRMPTTAEFQELYNNCTSVWTTLNGVYGRLFTSNLNGNQLFFPAAGYFNGPSNNSRGGIGDYWSSTYNSETRANIMSFYRSGISPENVGVRHYGFPVRAVIQSV